MVSKLKKELCLLWKRSFLQFSWIPLQLRNYLRSTLILDVQPLELLEMRRHLSIMLELSARTIDSRIMSLSELRQSLRRFLTLPLTLERAVKVIRRKLCLDPSESHSSSQALMRMDPNSTRLIQVEHISNGQPEQLVQQLRELRPTFKNHTLMT